MWKLPMICLGFESHYLFPTSWKSFPSGRYRQLLHGVLGICGFHLTWQCFVDKQLSCMPGFQNACKTVLAAVSQGQRSRASLQPLYWWSHERRKGQDSCSLEHLQRLGMSAIFWSIVTPLISLFSHFSSESLQGTSTQYQPWCLARAETHLLLG